VPHPAAFGAFPRVLGHFARDVGLFSLEEAVRKMTSLPADRLGLSGRGRIGEGLAADLVVLDPQTVADNTTFREPSVSPTGIEYVLVNGEVAVRDGAVDTTLRAGRVLRRGASDA
jgi:N-acyl-D-amino-acid deacylase